MKTYFCVLDFESTCWDGKTKNKFEIIEVPSVLFLIEEDKLTYIAEFQEYCRPQLHPKLSDFCTTLTGITQETVDKSEQFPVVIKNHYNWLVKNTNGEVEKVIFVTCGAWDFATALSSEVKKWKDSFVTNMPTVYKSFINIKDMFAKLYGTKAGGMVSMLNYTGITLEGRHHSGLDDCKNIGKILQKMYKEIIEKHTLEAFMLIQKVDLKPT